jgi:hypothetical protein
VRYFLTGRHPKPSAILLVESGSRQLLEGVVTGLRETWGPDIRIDIATCYSGLPRGFTPASTQAYSLPDAHSLRPRVRLFRKIARGRYSHLGIVCAGGPILLKWKCMLALGLPAKVFIINENGDYFWLDRKHLSAVRRFAIARSGLAGTGAVRTPARLFAFPFTLAWLALYAAAVHARRLLRLSLRRLGKEEYQS